MTPQELSDKLLKFHAPGGRYTYYPRRSSWLNNASIDDIEEEIKRLSSVDIYLHMPFCKELCTFCGCNIKITTNPNDFENYTKAIVSQWKYYKSINPELKVNRVYLGGGTPNYLPVSELEKIFSQLHIGQNNPLSIELDPRSITESLIQFLKNYQCERFIIGIQEIDEKVLSVVNRAGDKERIITNIKALKELNPKDITGEFIYGLPFQSVESLKHALEIYTTDLLSSVQLYPLAPVPWNESVQKSFGPYEPLGPKELNDVLAHASQYLEEHNFTNMHFGLFTRDNSYYMAKRNQGELSRTMMGTMPYKASALLGLGPSSISKVNGVLFQNDPLFERFQAKMEMGNNALIATHCQSEREQQFESLLQIFFNTDTIDKTFSQALSNFAAEGLISNDGTLRVSNAGKHFSKYICHSLEISYF